MQFTTQAVIERRRDLEPGDVIAKRMAEKVREELKNVFNPEFLNRLDDTIVFHPLSREHIALIEEA